MCCTLWSQRLSEIDTASRLRLVDAIDFEPGERVGFACLFWRATVSALAHKNKLYRLRAYSLAFLAQFGNGIVIALRPSSGVEPFRHSPEKAELLVREGRKATDHWELMPRDRRAAESEI